VKRSIFGVAIVLAFVAVGIAAAPPLTFTFKDVHANKTAQETDTYAINIGGMIAGDYVDSAGVQHPMILAGTKLTTANYKGCSGTPGTNPAFYGLNSSGVAAGYCTSSTTGNTIAFTYNSKTKKFTNILIKSGTSIEASGINDKGAVVGTYVDSAGKAHGFLKVGAKVTNLDPPGAASGTPVGPANGFINNKGVITIFASNSAGSLISFTTADSGKTYKPFHGKGEGPTGTAIHNLNNKGDIVATVFDTAGNRHGILLHAGKQYVFDDPSGVNATRADGLNDKLAIVGRYGSGVFGGFGFFAQAK
jgi:probable HAF family extracellular repeat protein